MLPSDALQRGRFIPATAGVALTIPDECNMVYFICQSAGGGGGGGRASAGGGGGGGGPGSTYAILFPAFLLRGRVYVTVGAGGAGGASAVNGTGGSTTIIRPVPNSVGAGDAYVSVSGGGGGVAGGAAAGTAGTVGTIGAVTNDLLQVQGLGSSTSSFIGSIGGLNNQAGANVTPTARFCGGAGGGGYSSTAQLGGSIVGSGLIPSIGPTAVSQRGPDGIWQPDHLLGTGGCGGGSHATLGLAGGNGAYGCGGGGGGCAVGTGGAGGRGGDGFVFVLFL